MTRVASNGSRQGRPPGYCAGAALQLVDPRSSDVKLFTIGVGVIDVAALADSAQRNQAIAGDVVAWEDRSHGIEQSLVVKLQQARQVLDLSPRPPDHHLEGPGRGVAGRIGRTAGDGGDADRKGRPRRIPPCATATVKFVDAPGTARERAAPVASSEQASPRARFAGMHNIPWVRPKRVGDAENLTRRNALACHEV